MAGSPAGISDPNFSCTSSRTRACSTLPTAETIRFFALYTPPK
jgi:hypothetical protein